jgi:O-antigen/teichoic acid export membrane protein
MNLPPSPQGTATGRGAKRVLWAVAVYTLAVLGVIVVADLVLPSLALPEWGILLVIVIAALVFPLALVIAWTMGPTTRKRP